MVVFFEIPALALLAGAAEGLVRAIVKPAEHPRTVPCCQCKIRLGFLRGIALGGGTTLLNLGGWCIMPTLLYP
jgi:hypothetical protein